MAPATPIRSRQSSRAQSREGDRSETHPPNKASDKTTLLFVQRVLCSGSRQTESSFANELSLNDLLPSLTSSNELDIELYAYVAIIIKECVQTWYAKFTPDQTFIDEIVHTIAHCTRGLEERARKTNLEVLVLDDIPALLDAHVVGMCQ